MIDTPSVDPESLTRAQVDQTPVRCPDLDTSQLMEQVIVDASAENDSLGGIITCVCRNVPVGLGEPVFDKIEALLAQAMLSIPAVKGFDLGSGFAGTRLKGSEHNDPFIMKGRGSGPSRIVPAAFRVEFQMEKQSSLGLRSSRRQRSDNHRRRSIFRETE